MTRKVSKGSACISCLRLSCLIAPRLHGHGDHRIAARARGGFQHGRRSMKRHILEKTGGLTRGWRVLGTSRWNSSGLMNGTRDGHPPPWLPRSGSEFRREPFSLSAHLRSEVMLRSQLSRVLHPCYYELTVIALSKLGKTPKAFSDIASTPPSAPSPAAYLRREKTSQWLIRTWLRVGQLPVEMTNGIADM